jgi:hypothetical protein
MKWRSCAAAMNSILLEVFCIGPLAMALRISKIFVANS